jgi:hypothetical protein
MVWMEAAERKAHGSTLAAAPEPPPEAESCGFEVTADDGLLGYRELDAALGLSAKTGPQPKTPS